MGLFEVMVPCSSDCFQSLRGTLTFCSWMGIQRADSPSESYKKSRLARKKTKWSGKSSMTMGVTSSDNNNTKFKKDVFRVLCYQPGSRNHTPSYWCEKETGGEIVERDIQEFDVGYLSKLLGTQIW